MIARALDPLLAAIPRRGAGSKLRRLAVFGVAIGIGVLGTSAAPAGPPAPCGYYPNSLVPRICGNFYPRSGRGQTARCRDGTYVVPDRQSDACASHGGTQSQP
jgi:hypothetical protein